MWDALYAYFMLKDLEEKHAKELFKMDRISRLKFLREKVQSSLPK